MKSLVAGFISLKRLDVDQRTSAAEWGCLPGMARVVPLLMGVTESVIAKVVLQLMWVIFITRSAFLANETWQRQNQNKRQ